MDRALVFNNVKSLAKGNLGVPLMLMGLLILAINIIGGIAIGMAQHGLDFSLAVERYALLTIGDGLVAQIPSLLLSTAAAIMVTRTTSSQDLGFLMPSVHIRDNLDLMPNVYRITLMGVTIAEVEIHPERELAIDPGQVFGKVEGIEGIEGKDPAFGLDAIWIEPEKKDQAQSLGYTVVDASTVVATHLNQVLQTHAYELLGHEEVQKWLGQLEKVSPKLAEELVPSAVNISVLLRVLQNLLKQEVPIRDMRSIAESIVNLHPRSQDPKVLTTVIRQALRRMIVQSIVGNESEIPVITLDPDLEQF